MKFVLVNMFLKISKVFSFFVLFFSNVLFTLSYNLPCISVLPLQSRCIKIVGKLVFLLYGGLVTVCRALLSSLG